MKPLLSIKDLQVHFSNQDSPVRAVDGVNLELHAKEIFALVGESGCGKTSLALAIGRLLPTGGRIAGGTIHFKEMELTHLSDEKLRRIRGKKIAYVFQDPMSSLNPVLSIREQLMESIWLNRRIKRAHADDLALQLLMQVRLPLADKRMRQYPHQLSGGMRQRVMIAMALAREPELLIADEPTTALDVTTQAEILGLLEEIKQGRGMSILLITHDLGAVAKRSDRIGVMKAGKLFEVAPTHHFYKHPDHPYSKELLSCIPRLP